MALRVTQTMTQYSHVFAIYYAFHIAEQNCIKILNER